MNRIRAFTIRNIKELLRDPLTLCFGIGMPIALLLIVQLIMHSIPQTPDNTIVVPQFIINNFAPAMAVFSLSFISLFSGMMVSKDRTSAFLMRLFASPLTAFEFIISYTLPYVVMALIQTVICFGFACIFGYTITVSILVALALSILVSLFYVSIGILLGSFLNDKQTSAICGGGIVTIASVLSGAWFDVSVVTGVFKTICYVLPFANAVDMVKSASQGDFAGILPHIWIVLAYTIVIFAGGVVVFSHKMKNGDT
ncbi:MAG: ABC transporter permease [Clostridia bacterium]|nr:ABC transporter permease [Clostridia bacterium]